MILKIVRNNIYYYIKCAVYAFGALLTVFSSLKYGLVSSHTPPIGFIISLFIVILASTWIIVDWVLFNVLNRKIDFNYKIHYLAIIINLIFLLYILYSK